MEESDKIEKLALFCKIMNIPQTDPVAVSVLQAHDWNLEAAIDSALAGGLEEQQVENPNIGQRSASPVQGPQEVSSSHSMNSNAHRPLPDNPPQQQQSWGEWFGTLPGGTMINAGLSAAAELIPGAISAVLVGSDGGPPVQPEQQQFLLYFERKYGSSHPNFYAGTPADAMRQARDRGQLVFIYLHSKTHQNIDQFCGSILTNDLVCEFLNSNFTVWAGEVHHSVAYDLASQLGVNSYPFIAVLSPPSSNSQRTMRCVYRHQGLISAEDLVNNVSGVMERHQNEVSRSTRRQLEHSSARMIRQEQDLEYQEALARDREQARLDKIKQKEEEEQKMQEAEARVKEDMIVEEKERLRQEALRNTPDEPSIGTADCVNIQFRLPNGKMVKRRFLESHTIENIRSFVDSHELIVDGGAVLNYDLITNYPRKIYSDYSQTLGKAGIVRSANIFVTERFED